MATIILFLGGVELVFLGIIGEYIARIYEQAKNRPHFIVEYEINSLNLGQKESKFSDKCYENTKSNNSEKGE